MAFTHLQVRTGYSLFESTVTIHSLVERAKALQFSSLAITDEAVLYGVIPFYKACMEKGIKPIIGMTVKVPMEEGAMMPVVLLAKTNHGYKQLMKISTHIQMGNICTLEFLESHQTDLICILVANESSISLCKEQIPAFRAVFPKELVYVGLEVTNPNHIQQMLEAMTDVIAEFSVRVVALGDVRYLNEQEDRSYACLRAMKAGKGWNQTIEQHETNRYLRSQEEMAHIFAGYEEIVTETERIANQCHVTFDFTKQLLPEFPVPTGDSPATYLKKICTAQIPIKYANREEAARERLAYELQIIDQLGFNDYFLIVADFVQFAKDNGIMVGPGRGSAAGSIVSFLLGITAVDPLAYGLLFERFLNPERVTMPDIDIDFSDNRREEVIDYVREKYGQAHVAQIITFGTFAARSLLRELMKTMDIHSQDQKYILKQVPVQANRPIMTYVNESEAFQSYIKQSPKLQLLFSVAEELEGLPRHISTHAAGIVIGKEPLLEDVPLTKGTHDTYLTQYAMNELEAIGLLKIDMLGLKNLSMMERIIKSIARTTKQTIDLAQIPEDDAATFTLLQKGNTNGIFQLESQGMKQVLVRLKPTSLEDIIAVNALYRPGPMENIPTYIERKHGHTSFTYIHPDLEAILRPTYGVLIYQEQIMQIAHQFAGLSLGEADILRRAVSKKKRKLLEEGRESFISGCVHRGYDRQIAEEVFSWIVKFADYGFNKSHSVAYSKIAYQLSYLKANYPVHFFTELLGTVSNEANKLNMYVREAGALGIEVLPPSINKSKAYYSAEKEGIRIGLMAIKGIGYETVKEIMRARKERPFTDLFDFCLRVRHVKRNALETLILAGTFDETYENRASLLASIDQAMERADLFGDFHEQGDLFREEMQMKPTYTEIADFSLVQKLSDEKELLHLYVTSHPIKQHRSALALRHYLTLQKIKTLAAHNTQVKAVGIVQSVKKIHTKRGDSMAFMTLSDETAEMETVIFPDVYRHVNQWLTEEQLIQVEGKVSIRQNKKQLVIHQLSLVDFETITDNQKGHVYIKLNKGTNRSLALTKIQQTKKTFPGSNVIIVFDEKEGKTYKLGEKYSVEANEWCILQLKKYFGDKNVVLK